jgi:N-sulfoglucosamine sulfohydrolase
MITLNSAFVLAGLVNCTSPGPKQGEADTANLPPTPNFVFIIADDMAWDDSGAFGHPYIQTPNLDMLAKQGMKFNQAFLTASSCSPSRASIITGMYPHRTGAEQLHWPIPADKITFVEKLKEAGYWTAQAGKWHMGDFIKDRFDLVQDAGTEGFQLSPAGKDAPAQGDGSGCELWVPTLRERPKNQPFFLWLAAFDPHRPYYDNIIPNPHSPDAVIVPPYMPDNEVVRKELAQYYDEITRLDSYLGAVLDELEHQGVSDNTIIIFISDNGRPFPRDKTTLYDSGIRTPMIFKWPGVIEPGAESNSLVSSVDIAPTVLHLASLEPLQEIDGTDFTSLLLGPDSKIRDYIFAEANWHDYEDYSRAVRTTEFKYIRNYYNDMPNTPPADVVRSSTFRIMTDLRDKGMLTPAQLTCFIAPRPHEELYDITADPFELNNLAQDPGYSEILIDLRNQCENIRSRTNDRLPESWMNDEFDRITGEPNKYRIRPRPTREQMRSF